MVFKNVILGFLSVDELELYLYVYANSNLLRVFISSMTQFAEILYKIYSVRVFAKFPREIFLWKKTKDLNGEEKSL